MALLCAAVKVVPSKFNSWREDQLQCCSHAGTQFLLPALVLIWACDSSCCSRCTCLQTGCLKGAIGPLAAVGSFVRTQAGGKQTFTLLLLQASLFADKLVQDVWDVVNTLNSLREEHSNKQVRDQSLEALLAVLNQASYSKVML